MSRTTITLFAAALSVLLGGCSHTRSFNPTTLEGRAEVNAQAERRSTVLILTSGERVKVRALRLDPEGASWINPETGEARSVPLAEVRAVRFAARNRGALEGLAIGAGIGVGLGLFGILVEGDGEGLGGPSAEVAYGGVVFAGGLLGSLLGMGMGRTLYVPEPPPVGSGALPPMPSQADLLPWSPLQRP